MRIIINGEETTLEGVATVADLICRFAFHGRIAVEVNRELVTHGQFATRNLRDGDTVEIVRAIGGG
ncbi:MAG: sulfur carrier protein ThiS [Gammaproteobacteria bacterium]|nr:sulfur carrier protein ThiS [Gammaproteobacteria bacterium]